MYIYIYIYIAESYRLSHAKAKLSLWIQPFRVRLSYIYIYIYRQSIIWKSDLTDKMKRSFFQAAVVSILLYGCTTWTLTKWLKKKLDGNYTRMLRAILNKSWRQRPTRHQLYGHLPPITKTIQVRRTRHAGHCWRTREELISDVLLWTLTYGQEKAGRPARTYIQQLCEDAGCSPEHLPDAMNDWEKWRERVRDIFARATTWWWMMIYIYKYIYIRKNCFAFVEDGDGFAVRYPTGVKSVRFQFQLETFHVSNPSIVVIQWNSLSVADKKYIYIWRKQKNRMIRIGEFIAI